MGLVIVVLYHLYTGRAHVCVCVFGCEGVQSARTVSIRASGASNITSAQITQRALRLVKTTSW